jgi:L-threonylcarbamoyladenylate synthase
MIVLKYQKSNHKNIIQACVHALRQGKVVAFPTDTSYGLAVDATNIRAVKKLYRVKGRDFKKPVHVVVADQIVAKKLHIGKSLLKNFRNSFGPGQ